MSKRRSSKRLFRTQSEDAAPISLEPIDDDKNMEYKENVISHQSPATSLDSESFASLKIASPAPSVRSNVSTSGGGQKKKLSARRRVRKKENRESSEPETISEMDESANLYESILENRLSPKELATRWICDYKTDKNRSILSIKEFILNSCFCKCRINPEMQETEDSELIHRMMDDLDPENGEYPLILSIPKWRKYCEGFAIFFEEIIRQTKNSIIYDQHMLTKISNFFLVLSSLDVRALRHTATFAAMKMTTSLVYVAAGVIKNIGIARRQIEAESTKIGSCQGEKIESLISKLAEFEENLAYLKDNLHVLFTSIFVLRYIDICDDIRVICITEIGKWMLISPDIYLNDRYLKYVGWILFDKSPEVRFQCIHALMPIYDTDHLKPKLEGFTSKFKDRIVAMTKDKDSEVAVQALKLLTKLLRYYSEFLTDTDYESIYGLVYVSDPNIAKAAGLFLKEQLFTSNEESEVVVKSARGKQRLPNTPFIRDLVVFFIESEFHEYAAYLVDALIDSNPMIKDWECISDLLIEDPGPHEESLTDQAETCLINIMVCSVKQAATGEWPVGRLPAKKGHTKRELHEMSEEREKITRHFIFTLPILLEKYRADPEKLSNLLKIPRYFDLSIYTSLRQEENLDYLLRVLKEIVENVQRVECLEDAAKTLEYLCERESPIFGQTNVSRSILIDWIVDRYKETIVNYRNNIGNNNSRDQDEVFDVVQCLKKLGIFFSAHDINSWNIENYIFRDIEEAKNSPEYFTKDAIIYCIISCRCSLVWAQYRLTHPADDPHDVMTEKARRLKQRLNIFMESMIYFVNNSHPNVSIDPEVREEAYCTICDLLFMFSKELRKDVYAWSSLLVYEVDDHMQGILIRYVEHRVFTEFLEDSDCPREKIIEELNKRRNILAGYCKLIAFNAMATINAADIFKHYLKFNNHYDDIIKMTIIKARSINEVNCILTIFRSLRNLWIEAAEKNKKPETNLNLNDTRAIKELAKKFVFFFGPQNSINREAFIRLHIAAINFAVDISHRNPDNPSEPPPELKFLEILEEFTWRLPMQDKRAVLDYLNSKVQGIIPSNPGKEWEPLIYYRKYLTFRENDKSTIRSETVNENNEGGNTEENAIAEKSVKTTKRKKKKLSVPNKHPLPVTITTRSRVTKNQSLQDTNNTITPNSPVPEIDDSSRFLTLEEIPSVKDNVEASLEIENYHQRKKSRTSVRYPTASELFEDEILDPVLE